MTGRIAELNEHWGTLVVAEFNQGVDDHDMGTPPPRLTTWSYDIGRTFAARVPSCCRNDKDYLLCCRRGCRHGAKQRTIPQHGAMA